MKPYTASILGGSGSVGKCILRSLLADSNCQSVLLVSRRPLDDIDDGNKDRVKVHICNPIEDMSTLQDHLKSTNIAFNALGVGAPVKVSKEELYKVDVTIPTLFAEKCKEARSISHYCLLSAVNADASATWSNITKTAAGGGWYNHCKGVVEANTEKAGFQYVFIAQPGTLLGSPHTPTFMNFIPSFLIPEKYSSAQVSDIAAGMVRATVNAYQKDTAGVVRVSGGIPISNAE